MNKTKIVQTFLSLAVIAALLVIYAVNKNSVIHKYNRHIFGMNIEISIPSDSEADSAEASNRAFGEIERIENLLSIAKDGSDITRINNSWNNPVKISAETINLIGQANNISRITGGAFEITAVTLSQIWDIEKNGFVPPVQVIKNWIPFVSNNHIIINASNLSAVMDNKLTKAGIEGIAAAYALNSGIALIKKTGVSNALISAGKHISAAGKNNGKPWNIAIKNPRSEGNILSLSLNDMESISTVGDYDKFKIIENIRYHNLIDPRTGYPSRNSVSVSVISKNSVESYAFAEAFFYMGKEAAAAYLNTRNDMFAVFIDNNLKCRVSKELKNRITITSPDKNQIEWF